MTMKTVAKVLVVLAALALSASAYLDPQQKYLFAVQLNTQFVNPGSNNNADTGYAIFAFNPSNNQLQYWLFNSLPAAVTVKQTALFGPSACYQISGTFGFYNQYMSSCYLNTGQQQVLLSTLPTGATVSTITLNPSQVQMLFNNELYIRVDTSVLPNGHLGGRLIHYSYAPQMGAQGTTSLIGVAYFGGNPSGQFPLETASSTSNTGIVVLTWNSNQPNTISWVLYHTAVSPGQMSLTCPNVKPANLAFTNNAKNGLMQNTDFSANKQLLPEVFTTSNCYFTITTSAYPNGELFGRIGKFGMYEFLATGANEPTNTQTSNFVTCMGDYDMGSKLLGLACYSNITTDSVLGMDIVDVNAGVICSYNGVANNQVPTTAPGQPFTTIPPFVLCQFNSSFSGDINNGNVYINVRTTANPSGSVKATAAINTGSTGISYASQGLSQGGQIAIGVVFGVLGFVLIVGGLGFFAYKKGLIKLPEKI